MDRVLHVQGGKNYPGLLPLISLLVALLFSPLALSQHEMHNMPDSGGLHVISMPDNDEVLGSAPESIMLHFESEVRLVKLALREPGQGKDPIEIGFRYRPEAGVHFVQSLPVLSPADYYIVEWAAFDANQSLIKGVFYFSFGDDARPPSYYLDQIKHPEHIMSPDYRLL